MSLAIGANAPDFTVDDDISSFHDWRNGSRALIVALKALSPTCTTECQTLLRLKDEFKSRNVKLIALSGDTQDDLGRWSDDLQALFGHGLPCRLVIDHDRTIATSYDIAAPTAPGGLQRALFIVAPDGRIEFASCGPVTAGRNFEETLRLIDSIRLTQRARVATSAEWRPGDPVWLPPSLPQEEAEQRYGATLQTFRPYLRMVPGP